MTEGQAGVNLPVSLLITANGTPGTGSLDTAISVTVNLTPGDDDYTSATATFQKLHPDGWRTATMTSTMTFATRMGTAKK